MSDTRLPSKWFRGRGRGQAKRVRPRLVLEALEDRQLLAVSFLQTNLASDLLGVAQATVRDLIDPWGLAIGPSSQGFWVASRARGESDAFAIFGNRLDQPFAVTIPFGAPTGAVFNSSGSLTDFHVTDGVNTRPATFLFASETGWITGWNPAVGGIIPGVGVQTISPNAEVGFEALDGAVYKGLALSKVGAANFLYTTDFHNGRIDVLDGRFNPVALGTNGFETFTDPNLPRGFAPFGIANLGGKLFVTYARQDADGQDDVPGAGNGFVDVFETNGHFDRRLASGGDLNSPWGLAVAPAGFGDFGGALLVGNSGDGQVHAFDLATGRELGALATPLQQPVAIAGLRALEFGTGGPGGDPNTLLFTAGLDGRAHGLFGALRAVTAQSVDATPIDIMATAEVPFTGTVASFTGDGPGNTPADFAAVISWGDGSQSPGTITADGRGGFTVTGTHTYARPPANPLRVTISDNNPTNGFFGTLTQTGSTATVLPATPPPDRPLHATGITVTATQLRLFTGAVASFTDDDPNATFFDFHASIDWGDGHTTPGVVLSDGHGGFTVFGTNTYDDVGFDSIKVTITDLGGVTDAGGSMATASSTATVHSITDQLLFVASLPIHATAGQQFTGPVVDFADADPTSLPTDFIVGINWGDGTVTSATITPDGEEGFFGIGTHTYAQPGTFTVTITVTDTLPNVLLGLGTGTASNMFTVAPGDPPGMDQLLDAHGVPVATTEGATFTGPVATFTDADPLATAADFMAAIVWGDGHTSDGTVTSDGRGGFLVSGTNTYAEAGTHTVTVTLTDRVGRHDSGGSTATASTTATVQDAALLLTPAALDLTPGLAADKLVVATFTDAKPEAVAHYTAKIDWGDGSPATPGTVSVSGATFSVAGSHVYAGPGRFTVNVTVHDGTEGTTTAGGAALAGTATQRFVAQVFQDLLQRPVDPAGLAFWDSLLAGGVTRAQVVQGVEASPEFRSVRVTGLYQQLLHRAPDAAGLDFFTSVLAAGGSVEQVAAAIAGSPEFAHKRGNDTADGFLSALFQDALGRTPDAAGQALFEQALAQGATAAQVAAVVFASAEFHQDRAGGLFGSLLRRPATDAEAAFFAAAFQAGARDEDVAAVIAGSDEYFRQADWAGNPQTMGRSELPEKNHEPDA